MPRPERSRRKFLRQIGTTAVIIAFWHPFIGKAFAAKECYPNQADVRWIVPYSPGGGYNVYARLLEPFVEDTTGAEVVVENISGAGGLVGMSKLFEANPNGRTLGLLNAAGLIMAGVSKDVAFTIDEYTLLGRVIDSSQIWAVGKPAYEKGIKSIWDVVNAPQVIFGDTGAGSNTFFGIVSFSELLGVKRKLVTGYPGQTETALAAIRGEIDLMERDFYSLRRSIADGEFFPILQLTESPIKDPLMQGVPLVVDVAKKLRAPVQDVSNVVSLVSAGRVIAGPPKIRTTLADCLGEEIYKAMSMPGFAAAAKGANRPVQPLNAERTRKAMRAAGRAAKKFAGFYEKARQEIGR
jgi:tripartite-type tricarboxylate transporter receptor subunit TctC